MSDDLMKQLSSYKAQLQQVEVALSTDPDNEDLLKLQKDLQVCVSLWIRCVEVLKGCDNLSFITEYLAVQFN